MTALHHIKNRTKKLPPLRVGIGGPVGSGKTTLLEMLCKSMRTTARGLKPFVMTNLKTQTGLAQVVSFIERQGMLLTK